MVKQLRTWQDLPYNPAFCNIKRNLIICNFIVIGENPQIVFRKYVEAGPNANLDKVLEI